MFYNLLHGDIDKNVLKVIFTLTRYKSRFKRFMYYIHLNKEVNVKFLLKFENAIVHEIK